MSTRDKLLLNLGLGFALTSTLSLAADTTDVAPTGGIQIEGSNLGIVSDAINNRQPLANDMFVSVPEDSILYGNLEASDPDGDQLTYTLYASASSGSVDVGADGRYSYTPAPDFNGSDQFFFSVDDGFGGSSVALVTITVSPVNDAPVASSDTGVTTPEETPVTSGNLLVNDTDIDGDALSITNATVTSGQVVSNGDGTVTYTPDTDFVGLATVTVTVSDGNGGSDTSTFAVTVTNLNDAPVANNDDPISTSEETPVTTGNLLANDTDIDGDTLSITNATATSGQVVSNGDGTVAYTPNTDFFGSDTITVTVSDGNGGTDTSTVVVTVSNVNDAPVAVNDATLNTSQDTAATTLNVLSNDTDAENDTLTVTAATALHGTVTVNSGGTLTYTPDAGYVGSDTITYTVSDGNGGSDTGSVPVSVGNVNDAPVANNDDPISTSEETPVTTTNLLANDTDADGDTLSITNATATSGQVVNNGDGTVTFTPNTDFVGSATITVTVSDGNGGTDTSTVAVTVSNVNDAPVAVDDTTLNTTQDTAATTGNVLSNDTDVDNDTLTVTAATALNGSVTINTGGTLTYTPNTGYVGSDTITYTVSDGNGGSDTGSVPVNVANVNDAPLAADDPDESTAEDQSLTISGVLDNDSDPDGDPLTLSSASALNGSVTVSGSVLNYTPALNFNGTDTVTYIVSDGQGATDSAQVKVIVSPVNDTPTPANDSGFVTPLDTAITLTGLLDNDTDIDGDSLSISAVTASNGSALLNGDGSVTFTPALGFNGNAQVTYTVSDGSLTATAIASVTVLPPNSPPNAVDDSGLVMEAGTTLTLDGILNNDSDLDGDAIQLVAASASAGTVVVTGATSLEFTIPKDTLETTVQITYTIEDTLGQSDSAVVTVQIIPDNFAPIANDDTPVTINQGDSVTLDVLANDTDADGDALTVVNANVPVGLVTINTDGSLTYTADSVFTGDAVITYTIDDGRGARDSASVIVTVLPLDQVAENEIPSANNDPALTTEFETPIQNINVLANDTDPDGSELTVIQASAQYGSVQINTDSTLNYIPAIGFSGADVVTYTVSDGEGGRDSATFTVTVAAGATNAAPRAITDGPFTIGADQTQITFNVLANDVDPDGDPIELLNAATSEGTLTAAPDGTVRYTKPAQFDGSATITYTITDGRGGIGNGKATVTGPATIVNRVPIAVPDGPFTVVEGGRAKDIDLLANDSDPDADKLVLVSVSASNGTATVSDDNTMDYVTTPGFVGLVTVTYEVSDGKGGSATSTATIDVVAAKASNTAPTSAGGFYKVTTDETLTSQLPLATDLELDPIRYVMAIAPKDGIANVDGNGRFTYRPEPGFVGTDTFFFYVTDGQLNSRNYQVTLDIDGDSDGDGYLDSIDQCVNTDPGLKVDNTGCAIEEAEDFDTDGVPNDLDNCPSTPAGQAVDENGCSQEQVEEVVEDFRDIEDDVQEVAQVEVVTQETQSLATTVNDDCNSSIGSDVSSGQQSSLGEACQGLKSGENSSEQVKEAVEEINYEEVGTLADNAVATTSNQTQAIGNRMQVVNTGGGAGVVSVNGLNIRYGKQTIPTVALQEAVNAILGLAAGEGEDGESFLDFGKLGIFIQGDLDFGDRETQGNQTGYESDSWNITLGGDYRFTESLYAGLAVNVGETEVEYDTRGDKSTIDSWGLSIYGGWQITERWYVDGLVSYGDSEYSTLRNIQYTLNTGDFSATQRGDTSGTQLSYGLNTGYMYAKNGFRFGPILSVFYSDGTIDGFRERAVTGSDAWAFEVGKQSIKSTRLSAGLQMDYSWLTDFGVIVPGIRASYVREKEGSDDTITVRLANGNAFADGSSRFAIQNQKDDEGYYDISVNVSGQFVMGISGFVSYQFYQDYEGYTREGYSFGIRWDKPF